MPSFGSKKEDWKGLHTKISGVEGQVPEQHAGTGIARAWLTRKHRRDASSPGAARTEQRSCTAMGAAALTVTQQQQMRIYSE